VEGFVVVVEGSFGAATAVLGFWAEVLLPHVGRVFAFAAVTGEAGADATDDGCVEGGSRDNYLAFGEGRQVVQEVTANAFDGGGDAFLVDFVDDAHDALRLALAEHVGVELAGTLAD